MAEVRLPRSLVDLFPGAERRMEVGGAPDVASVLVELDGRFPGIWDRLCASGTELREYVNVFVDGERAELSTRVGRSSIVHVLPAVAGGSRVPARTPSATTRPGPGSAAAALVGEQGPEAKVVLDAVARPAGEGVRGGDERLEPGPV